MKTKQCECGTIFECKSLKKKRCPECDKQFRFERGRMAAVKHRALHQDVIKQQRKDYIQQNRKHVRRVWRAYNERVKNDPQKIVARRCRDRLRFVLKAHSVLKENHSQDLCGCTWQDLVEHIEHQFKDGMTWSNYGDWHIDHIKPCASFDLTDEIQLQQCFHFSNLQPLWASENCSKGAKY